MRGMGSVGSGVENYSGERWWWRREGILVWIMASFRELPETCGREMAQNGIGFRYFRMSEPCVAKGYVRVNIEGCILVELQFGVHLWFEWVLWSFSPRGVDAKGLGMDVMDLWTSEIGDIRGRGDRDLEIIHPCKGGGERF
jgi:hypothetical protein